MRIANARFEALSGGNVHWPVLVTRDFSPVIFNALKQSA
jgi:hypothetical protein